MAEEKIFADGFSFKRRENAPDFVVGRISVKVDDAISFLKQHQKNGWVNLNCNQSRAGKYYLELDTFVPKTQGNGVDTAPNQEPVQEDDLPF